MTHRQRKRVLAIRAAASLVLMLIWGSTAGGQEVEQPGGFWRWLDFRTSPFIPIPEVATDPNSGTSVGLLPVYLVTGEEGRIAKIYAPDVIYHPALGYGARFRLFGYPSEDTTWYVVGGGKQKIEREFDALYSTGITRSASWSLSGRSVYDRTATYRFFGIGNNTALADRTNYTEEQGYLDATLGRNLTPELQAALEMRPRFVDIEPGVLERSIAPGFLGGANDWLTRLSLSYDTRDSAIVPTRGTALTAFAGGADRHFLSSVSYTMLGLDGREIVPLGDRVILAGHAALRYMPGAGTVPFWALSRLGGEDSVIGEHQPLRGFGEGRFVDRNLFSASLEARTRVFDLDLFSQHLSFEIAPFVDAGRVFHRMTDDPFRGLHPAGGLGFRGIARPFVVGFVDVGYGAEGIAIFSGINYPF